jgi:hypothetical protein
MQAFEVAPVRRVGVEVYTGACHVTGLTASRFTRVADILNLLGSSHLILEDATLAELSAPHLAHGARRLHVALDEVLILLVAGEPAPRPEMRIPKRPVRGEIVLPPFRLSGTVHVGIGSRPVDGLLNAGDRFLPMTDASITSADYPDSGREVSALAFRRDRAHVMAVADDEAPDEPLAEVLDAETAQRWLRSPREVVP